MECKCKTLPASASECLYQNDTLMLLFPKRYNIKLYHISNMDMLFTLEITVNTYICI